MIRKIIAIYLSVAILVIGVVQSLSAGVIPSEMTLRCTSQDLEKIQKFLEMKIVSQRLKDFGYSEKEIMERLSNLDEQTLHKIALKIDEIKIAGDAGTALILALLIIALVVLIINLTGHRVVIR
ncbi:MAG: PA2779 family protein [Thermodesulfovibrio sp.]|nr:PA2779 family protein [Thermodesulfovibrio sp.]MCX7724997.1 PA2779 family protein [Thermodesulfovibrio sp.]MDW7973324.1 PA2779 family protein [Thermodesulfovibrio sp.]